MLNKLLAVAVLWGAVAHAAPRRVLVVMSAADEVSLEGGRKLKTGYFLRELSDPLARLLRSGAEVTFASPGGRVPVVDEFSKRVLWYRYPVPHEGRRRRDAALAVIAARGATRGDLGQPLRLEDLTEADLAGYDGLFVPGGHAPVANLVDNEVMGRVLRHFHAQGKPTALICHAPIALLSAREPGRPWIYAGYRVSAATTAEERIMEKVGPMRPHRLSFQSAGREEHYVDEPLARAGAMLVTNPLPSFPRVTQDRELITGQNPASAEALGDALVNALATRHEAAFRELRGMTFAELAKLFEEAATDDDALRLPTGVAAGQPLLLGAGAAEPRLLAAVVPPGYSLDAFAGLFWGGKVFEVRPGAAEGTLTNRLFPGNSGREPVRFIRAHVAVGNLASVLGVEAASPLPGVLPRQSVTVDGKRSILLDYRVSRLPLFEHIVDEIRPVLTKTHRGLYLGRAMTRDRRFWCFFALKFQER